MSIPDFHPPATENLTRRRCVIMQDVQADEEAFKKTQEADRVKLARNKKVQESVDKAREQNARRKMEKVSFIQTHIRMILTQVLSLHRSRIGNGTLGRTPVTGSSPKSREKRVARVRAAMARLEHLSVFEAQYAVVVGGEEEANHAAQLPPPPQNHRQPSPNARKRKPTLWPNGVLLSGPQNPRGLLSPRRAGEWPKSKIYPCALIFPCVFRSCEVVCSCYLSLTISLIY